MDSFLGLLDLQKEAVIGLDGQNIILKTDDFVGVRGFTTSCASIHFVTVKSQPNSTIAVGFFLTDENKAFVRRYDPQTEEISSTPVDQTTAENLVEQVRTQQFHPSQVLDYSSIVTEYQKQQWIEQTSYIQPSGILLNRNIKSDSKIIPGSYNPSQDEANLLSTSTEATGVSDDGFAVSYPCIPVVDPTLSLWKNKHSGTQRYLAQIPPSERTELFMSPRVVNRLLEDVLSKYYGSRWQALLGDLQLSYILFLYLQCFSSLEHW